MKYVCSFREDDRYVYVTVTASFEPQERDAIHAHGLSEYLLCEVTPRSFRQEYEEAKELEVRIEWLREEYQALPFFGAEAEKRELRREIAAAEDRFGGMPTPHASWMVRPAGFFENPTREIPFASYSEAKKAETEISRALTAFERRLHTLIPEPDPEAEPEEEREPDSVPLPEFSDQSRYEGMWILARPGRGKTQAISYLIMRDLERMARGDRLSVLLMDSEGNTPGEGDKPPPVLHTLSHLKLFAPGEPLHGKLVYITPRDNPGIRFNLFDLGFPGSPSEKYAATHELITFVLTALMDDEFSPSMRRLFTRCVRVMLERPGATLADFSELLIDPKPFAEEIARTSPRVQAWFANRFNESGSQGFRATRDAVLDRLDGLEMLPDFERMISNPRTEFSLVDELEAGKVVIVDTSSRSRMATAAVGRFFLALIDAVSSARVDMPEARKTPAFIYLDELAAYCGSHANYLPEILSRCRKQNIAVCAANQYLVQLETAVRSALRGSAIKLANPEPNDAEQIAPTMGDTDYRFLTNRDRGVFAFHESGMPAAVLVRVPYPNLSALPAMDETEYDDVRRQPHHSDTDQPQNDAPVLQSDTEPAHDIGEESAAQLMAAREELERCQHRGDWARAGELLYSVIPNLERLIAELDAGNPLAPPAEPPDDPDAPHNWS